jgi:hypothetical protein
MIKAVQFENLSLKEVSISCPQSARDIESKMRNETRLKLFTLDPDTQVSNSSLPKGISQSLPAPNVDSKSRFCIFRNLTSQGLSLI